MKIFSVFVLFVLFSQNPKLGSVDKAFVEGDLFDTGDFESLAFLDGLHEAACLLQGFVRSCVKPGESPAEQLDMQGAALQILAVDVGDLQFSAREGCRAFAISMTSLS